MVVDYHILYPRALPLEKVGVDNIETRDFDVTVCETFFLDLDTVSRAILGARTIQKMRRPQSNRAGEKIFFVKRARGAGPRTSCPTPGLMVDTSIAQKAKHPQIPVILRHRT